MGTISYRYRTVIVPLSYRSDCWNGKVDCSHGSGPLSYQFWDLFTRVQYSIVPKHFAPKQAKENLICQQISNNAGIRSTFYLKFNKHEKK